jgi:sortase A
MQRLTRVEWLLWTIGLSCFGYCVLVAAWGASARHAAAKVDPQGSGGSQPARADEVQSRPKDLIGRIDIPALGLTAPIEADYDPASLRKGVGHIRGTAMPGGLGTVGLAGHRDTFFRPLRAVKPAMEVHLTDAKGTYRYTVDATEIVSPDRVDVLNASAQPGLTLVTCYPFDYVGAAPKRFIVHARLISVVPEHILSW